MEHRNLATLFISPLPLLLTEPSTGNTGGQIAEEDFLLANDLGCVVIPLLGCTHATLPPAMFLPMLITRDIKKQELQQQPNKKVERTKSMRST